MTELKKNKWDLDEAIAAGEKAYALGNTYFSQLNGRLTKEKLANINTNVTALNLFKEKNPQYLIEQKAKTAGKLNNVNLLKTKVKNLRKIVKDEKTSTPEQIKAFGVGETLTNTESRIIASANLIISAYTSNKEWCNQIGIIESDIIELTTLINNVKEKETQQDEAKKTKTSGTFDKNNIHRALEDDVTSVSNIGVNTFSTTDPAIAKLFANIIPSADNGGKEDTTTETTETKTS